ncbi:MAG: pyrroline-5-carboxylate reductase [Candidatus Omnitrophota bacterium]|nr:pyrroline-5-carboxylate reductase [Candidatus Omnitrophota bacterium]
MTEKKIGIIGCGNMGEALLSRLSGLIEKSASLMVSEEDAKRRGYIQTKYKIIVQIDNNAVVKYCDVIILAVKPDDFDSVLKQEVCRGISDKKLLISIAAGVTTKYIEKAVGADIPVIRAMPNMGAIIGESITSISKGSSAAKSDMDTAREIFETIGDVVEVDEKLVDAVTAISGSGPAYFFYLIEALIEAAGELGLDPETAKRLVTKTATGSARLLEELKEDPESLRKRVASKGGTTEAALKIFEKKAVKRVIKDAVKAAHKRSKELARR